MNKTDVINILKDGHEIGLHSHTHPTRIDLMNKKKQIQEYKVNYIVLKKINKKILTVLSHPCGRYNQNTIKVLRNLNIEIGFRSNNHIKKIKSCFEIPRIDHTEILNKLKKENMPRDKLVYIVHSIDTEGPLHESLDAKFERVKDLFGIDNIDRSLQILKN